MSSGRTSSETTSSRYENLSSDQPATEEQRQRAAKQFNQKVDELGHSLAQFQGQLAKMSQNDSTAFPASMGPGARPVQNGRSTQSNLQEIMKIRSSYVVERQPNGIALGYQLKGAARYYNIAFDAIPLGGLSQTLLYGGPNRARLNGIFVIDCIRGAENMTGQVMNQKEVESFALHCSKRMMYGHATNFTGLAVGWGLAYTGRKDMKFPFMKPKDPERYTKFPNRYLPILQGQYARTMWQITRFNVYALLALVILGPFGSSMGNVSMMVGLYRDDRTKEYMKGIKGTLDRLTSNQDRSRRGLPPGPPPQRQPQNEDDSSSQDYGSFSSATLPDSHSESYSSASSTTYGSMMDSPSTDQSIYPQSSSATRPRGPPTPPPQQPPQQSSSSDYFFDDASPTAGNDPDPTAPAAYTGSAWERIRKGQQPSSTPNTRTQPSQSPSSWRQQQTSQSSSSTSSAESFSFASGDEEKALAKRQAQAEFDEMLDKERRESGNAEYERSMNAAGQREVVGSESGGDGSGSGSAWARRRRG